MERVLTQPQPPTVENQTRFDLVVLQGRTLWPPREPTPWQIPKDFEGIMAFNPRHYIQAYLDLSSIKSTISPAEYQIRLQQQNKLTYHDLQKTIMERLIAAKSTIHYHINENGKLINEDFSEPALERFERGQRWLEENGSNEVEREKAEVAGMYKVETLLASGQDMTIVVASARSEACTHTESGVDPKDEPEDVLYHQQYVNVYVQEARAITMTQYHSTHNYDALLKALQKIDPEYPQSEEAKGKPAFMLANPAVSSLPIEAILQKFAIDTKTTAPEVCAEVLEACTPIFLSFIQTLVNNPLDILQIKKTVNAMYNVTDETQEKIKRRNLRQAKTMARSSIKVSPFRDTTLARTDLVTNNPAVMSAGQLIDIYGSKPAKTKGGACPGKQKSFEISLGSTLQRIAKMINATSVADFADMAGNDDEIEDIECPRCHGMTQGGVGKTACDHCGLTKEEAGSNCA